MQQAAGRSIVVEVLPGAPVATGAALGHAQDTASATSSSSSTAVPFPGASVLGQRRQPLYLHAPSAQHRLSNADRRHDSVARHRSKILRVIVPSQSWLRIYDEQNHRLWRLSLSGNPVPSGAVQKRSDTCEARMQCEADPATCLQFQGARRCLCASYCCTPLRTREDWLAKYT
jgi:hypothetical protein